MTIKKSKRRNSPGKTTVEKPVNSNDTAHKPQPLSDDDMDKVVGGVNPRPIPGTPFSPKGS
jgi:hypothetical protein